MKDHRMGDTPAAAFTIQASIPESYE